MNHLQALLEPQSIAIVGASNDPNKIGGRPLEYLQRYGYGGQIYPINPKYTEIQSMTCYASMFDVPDAVDLVIIAVPRQFVLDMLHDCGKKKVKAVIIFSSGFAELGVEGRKIQEEIAQLSRLYGMRIVGPNCQGVVNLKLGSLATFSTCFAAGEEEPTSGSTAIVSQSGAVAAMLYNIQKKSGRGIKYWIGSGNEADVHVPELLQVIIDDPEVKVLQVYIEDVKDGGSLIQAAQKANERKKPILALKSGRTAEGSKAASSHTGALAAEDSVFAAIFEHYGIVRVDSVIELGLFPQVFELDQIPRGKNVAIITNSGGLGVMMIDKCKQMGLDLAVFSEETKDQLSQVLPVFASVQNPIDVATQFLNDRELLAKIFPILMRDSHVDIILIGLGILGQGYDIPGMIEQVVQAQQQGDALIALTGVGCGQGVIEHFSKNGVPAFEDPTLCIKAVAKYADYHFNFQSDVNEEVECEHAHAQIQLPNVSGYLNEYDSKHLLKEWGLPVTREILCITEEEACQAGQSLGYPVAMKISSPFIQHKTEIGGVQLHIGNEEQLRAAYKQILANAQRHVSEDEMDGILVQEMIVDRGFEISLGLKRDPVFGPIIMVASGGIYIEILKDFQLLVPPVTYNKAKKAVDSLTMSPLLRGARGKVALDVDALCHTIVSFSKFVTQVEAIEESDLNPVIVLEQGKGVKIIDSLIKLKN